MTLVTVVFLVISVAAQATTISETFSTDPGWKYEALNQPAGSWTPTFQDTGNGTGLMLLQPPDTWAVRTYTPFALDGDFTVVLTGSTYSNGSNLGTHIKHYASIMQHGHTDDPSLQLLGGFSPQGSYFDSDTHYDIDLGAESTSFTIKFVRSGNTISTYRMTSGAYSLLNTYTIQQPDVSLYLELAEFDLTSMADGYSIYTSMNVSPEPATVGILILGGAVWLGGRRRRH